MKKLIALFLVLSLISPSGNLFAKKRGDAEERAKNQNFVD